MKSLFTFIAAAVATSLAAAAPSAGCAVESTQELKRVQSGAQAQFSAGPASVDSQLALYAAYTSADMNLRDKAFGSASLQAPASPASFHRALYLLGLFSDGTALDAAEGRKLLDALSGDTDSPNSGAAALVKDSLGDLAERSEVQRQHLLSIVQRPGGIDFSTEAFVSAEMRSRNLLHIPLQTGWLSELANYSTIYSKWYSAGISEISSLIDCAHPISEESLLALQPFNEDNIPPFEAEWAQWSNSVLRVAVARKMSACKLHFETTQQIVERQFADRKAELQSFSGVLESTRTCAKDTLFNSGILTYTYSFWYRMNHPGEFVRPKPIPTSIG